MTIIELVASYRTGEITFADVLTAVPGLTWGQRREESDGEIWWDGENTAGDVDILWYENLITDAEREAILNAIP